MYLAYYDPDVHADFYQSVIVFEGDNNFTAYVPAIADQFYEQE